MPCLAPPFQNRLAFVEQERRALAWGGRDVGRRLVPTAVALLARERPACGHTW